MSTSSLARERQQTEQLLTALQRAGGAEVTYDELRDAGIESPATEVLKLELAGVPVERCYRGRWLQRPSFRLAAADEPAARPAEGEPEWGPVRVYGAHAVGAPRLPQINPRLPRFSPRLPRISPARILSATALLAAAVTVTILVLRSTGGDTPRVAQHARSTAQSIQPSTAWHHLEPRPSRPAAHPQSHPAPRQPTPAPATSSASALETRGHGLLDSGQYTSAIPVLREAAQATGESATACAQPTSQSCLTYAFALFDLGRALRLSGDSAAAIPILQTRLRINDQRDVVAQELALAQGGSPNSGGSPSALEARGHSLLDSGQYASAIPVLQQAVKATGESPDACTQPTSQTCMTYAFALYDLGHALRLSGDASAAVPILKMRLRIDNQRDVVAQELRLAESGTTH